MPPPSCKLDLSIAIFMPERNDCAQSRLSPYKAYKKADPVIRSAFLLPWHRRQVILHFSQKERVKGNPLPSVSFGPGQTHKWFCCHRGEPFHDGPFIERSPFFIKNHLADEIRRHCGFRLRLQDPLRPAGSYTVKQPGHIPP